jgi:ABC-type molybdate transport system substrate-binding protein
MRWLEVVKNDSRGVSEANTSPSGYRAWRRCKHSGRAIRPNDK